MALSTAVAAKLGRGAAVLAAAAMLAAASPGDDAFAPDGRYAYLVSDGPGMEAASATTGLCTKECAALTVVDVEAGQIVATRSFDRTPRLIALRR